MKIPEQLNLKTVIRNAGNFQEASKTWNVDDILYYPDDRFAVDNKCYLMQAKPRRPFIYLTMSGMWKANRKKNQ